MEDQDETLMLFAPGTSITKQQIDHILDSEKLSAKLSSEELNLLRKLQQQFLSQGIEYVRFTLAPKATVLEGLQELSCALDEFTLGKTEPYSEPELDIPSGL